MLSGCGDNATAKTAQDTAPAVREERTEPTTTAPPAEENPQEEAPQEETWEDATSPPEEDVVEPTVDIDEIRHEYPNQNFYTYEEYVGTSWEEVNWQDINIIGPGPAGHITKDEYGLPVQDEFWLADGSFDGVGYLLCCGAQHVGISPDSIRAYFGGIHTTTYGTTDEFPLLDISGSSGGTVGVLFFNFEIVTLNNTANGTGTASLYDPNKYPPQNHPATAITLSRLRDALYACRTCDLYATDCPLDGKNIPHLTKSRDNNSFTCTEESMWH